MPSKFRMILVRGRRPETREGATLTKILVKYGPSHSEERIYLFGGLSRDLLSTLSYFVYTNQGIMFHTLVEDGEDRRKRYGHAAVNWENMLMIIGGAKHYNKETKRRDCLNDIFVFNPADEQWTELRCEGVSFEFRRFHTAVLIGKHLIVYGGMNCNDKFMGDLLGLTLGRLSRSDWQKKSYKWFKVNTKGAVKPGKLAFHTAQLVLNSDRYRNPSNIDLYSLGDSKYTKSRVFL